jgi:hypothetical protein
MNTEPDQKPPTDDDAVKAPPSTGKPPERDTSSQPKSRRASLGSVRRQLTDDELKSPAVQKLLMDILEEVEQARDEYKSYVNAFHSADKRAAVLGEKLNLDRSVEITFGVGTGLGGAILGIATYLWDKDPLAGVLAAVIGLGLIIGASIVRAVKR